MLDEYWTRNFGAFLPLAHVLRREHHERWVRFHSLPNAQRYTRSEGDWQVLLERQNTLLGAVAMPGCRITVLSTNWSESSEPPGCSQELQRCGLDASFWRSFRPDEDPSNWWHIYHSQVIWQAHALDCVIRLVADDVLSNVMLLALDNNWLAHPYDGGLDLILGTPGERNRLAHQFGSWSSRRRDGL